MVHIHFSIDVSMAKGWIHLTYSFRYRNGDNDDDDVDHCVDYETCKFWKWLVHCTELHHPHLCHSQHQIVWNATCNLLSCVQIFWIFEDLIFVATQFSKISSCHFQLILFVNGALKWCSTMCVRLLCLILNNQICSHSRVHRKIFISLGLESTGIHS